MKEAFNTPLLLRDNSLPRGIQAGIAWYGVCLGLKAESFNPCFGADNKASSANN